MPGKRKRVLKRSRSSRAGLAFPVGRVSRFLRKGRFAPRVSAGAPVSLAAALEYLVAEVVELAGNAALGNKRKRITPRHIVLGARKDSELEILFRDVDIPSGGVLPLVHKQLIKKKTKR